MFGISAEHLLILGVVLLFFGPRRLPELGNTLGKAIRNFKDAIQGVEEASFRRVEQPKTNAAPATAEAVTAATTAANAASTIAAAEKPADPVASSTASHSDRT
jgi:TatA/E family protein of Tat protein translocase